MFGLLKKETPVSIPSSIVSDNLDSIMSELLKYGQPRLGVYTSANKWSCNVAMNTNTPGSNFEISSEYGKHNTPLEAAVECRDRVLNAFKMIGK